jgi:cyclic pyranopterin phosphate synthase
MDTFLHYNFKVKINTVVMQGVNARDIIPMVKLTKKLPVSVRFIEEMPFNGGSHQATLHWNTHRILEHIKAHFPDIKKIEDAPHSTSYNYHILGHKGNIGIIAAYSRLFCGSCNRIRITPTGVLRTCLYDNGKLNIKDALREGLNNKEVGTLISNAISKKAKDGWEAEKARDNHQPANESMATIGG